MDNCKWCDKAKELLADNDIGYVEYPAAGITLKLFAMANLKTVPQIWDENYDYIGGFTQLKRKLEETYDERSKATKVPVN